MRSDLTSEQVRKRLWGLIRPAPGPYRRTQLGLAQEIGVSLPFLNDILHGKREPSGKVLEYLGLERVVTYRFRKKATAQMIINAVSKPSPP